MEVTGFLAFRLAGEVQGPGALEIGPIQKLEKELFAGSALAEAPAVELADGALEVRHTLAAQLGHAQGGGAGEQGVHMHQVVPPGVVAEPASEPWSDGEFAHGPHGRIQAAEGEHGHGLAEGFLLMPAAQGHGGLNAGSVVVGGEDRGIHPLLAQGSHHREHRLAGAAAQGADRGDEVENSQAFQFLELLRELTSLNNFSALDFSLSGLLSGSVKQDKPAKEASLLSSGIENQLKHWPSIATIGHCPKKLPHAENELPPDPIMNFALLNKIRSPKADPVDLR